MTTHQGERWLAPQIISVTGQTRSFDELIICDDGSTDRTLELIGELTASVASKTVVLEPGHRMGVVRNLGRGIARAGGDIIVLADQDDVWLPEKLAHLERGLSDHPHVGGVFSDGYVIDQRGRRTGRRLWESVGFNRRRLAQWNGGDPVGVLLRGDVVTGATVALRTEMRSLVLPFPEPGWHDRSLALLLAATCGIQPIDRPLIEYRLHENNLAGLPNRSIWRRFSPRTKLLRDLHERTDQLRAIVRRLEEHRAGAQVISQIERTVSHLEARSRFPESRLRRLTPASRELLRGGYRQGGGLRALARDLIGP